MSKKLNILVVKESRAGEVRVALMPDDVKSLCDAGHTVYVQSSAGEGVSQSDDAYRFAGANIRSGKDGNNLHALFDGIDVVVRVKRANHERELQELAAMRKGTVMVGALDPREQGSDHVACYKRHGIHAYSLDDLRVATDDPLNILASMSALTGKLALQDAIKKHQGKVQKVAIIAYGVAGQSALAEAVAHKFDAVVFCTRPKHCVDIEAMGATAVQLDKSVSLAQTQQTIADAVRDADVVISSARASGVTAPMLMPPEVLRVMRPGAVVVDLALSDGGNVAGSEHDKTITTEKGVMITNVSGYPKLVPEQASHSLSKASAAFVMHLSQQDGVIQDALIS